MQIKYIATDGKEFDDEDKCIEYERTISTVSTICSDLVVEEQLIPLTILLSNYVNDAGYLIPIEQCRFESFIIRSIEDINRIESALRDLGYYDRLARSIRNNESVSFPDILSIVSIKKDNDVFKYSKCFYMLHQTRIADRVKNEVLNILSRLAPKEDDEEYEE